MVHIIIVLSIIMILISVITCIVLLSLIFKYTCRLICSLADKGKIAIDIHILNLLRMYIETQWTGSHKKIHKTNK